MSADWSPRAERIAFDMPVRLRVGGRRSTVVLRNLTQDGARIDGMETLAAGDMTMVQLPGLSPKAAHVAWTRGDSAGLAFVYRLHADIFEQLVHRRTAQARPRTPEDDAPLDGERHVGWHAA